MTADSTGSDPRLWLREPERAWFDDAGLAAAAAAVRRTAHVVRESEDGRIGAALGGEVATTDAATTAHTSGQPARPPFPLLGTLPPLYPEWLGDRTFAEVHGCRFPYVVGEMANGIATARMVIEAVRAGLIGFFGAAGLSPARIETALDTIEAALGAGSPAWGANLIHSPNELDLEDAVAALYVRRGVHRVSSSAFMGLTKAVVHYAVSGLSEGPDGEVVRRNHLFAKVSRPEVAERFLQPAPRELLDPLVRTGKLTEAEARLAARVAVAEDLTVEADSGGHTDNRPLTALLPSMLLLRDASMRKHGYTRPIRVGAAGGLGTPSALAAAFALGAAYVLTGSVNQAAVEAGLADEGKALLAVAGLADVIMAPAADMFELGVKVQVLRRGTLFGVRALRLYELYTTHGGLDEIEGAARQKLEREILGASCEEVWASTRAFFLERDPREAERGDRDPKHRMALVFRWYLGLSSKWAIAGDARRRMDWQIWCGPAMGAFNDWARGSFLEKPENRTVGQIALNLLEGAAVVTRAQQLRSYGAEVPPEAFHFVPRPLA